MIKETKESVLPALPPPVSEPPEAEAVAVQPLVSQISPARLTKDRVNSPHTKRAYASDWAHFTQWCRDQNLSPLPPVPAHIGAYLAACIAGDALPVSKGNSASTIKRRLASLSWNYAQRQFSLDRGDPHIIGALASITNAAGQPLLRKEAATAQDIVAMLETLERNTLRGLRDRAMLLIGFSGNLRRSDIVSLDLGDDQSTDGGGWIEIFDVGILVTLRTRTGWQEVEIGRGSSDATCPVIAVQTWLAFARIDRGALFRRITGQGKNVGPDRLHAQEITRLVKRTARTAGVRGELAENERAQRFSGHSLRTNNRSGSATNKPGSDTLPDASHQRFNINLTRAKGL
jgi:integrase